MGAGRIGRIHAANLMAQPELCLRYVADASPGVAEALARSCGAQVATVDAVLGDPDVAGVIIATSTDTHLDLALRAHAAGKAIFCEKPVDLDLGRAVAAASDLAEARLFVGFNRRFDPSFAALERRLRAGELGKLETLQIVSNDPAPPPIDYVARSGGLFKDMTIHDFDMARFLLGDEPVEVFAWGSCLVDPAIGGAGDIDTARVMLKTANGAICTIANSRRSGFGYDQRIEAFCSGGMISADNVTETTLRLWRQDGATGPALQNFFLERYAAAFRAEMAHFADVVTGRAQPMARFADGIAALALADAAARSMATNAPVRLDRA
nr:inositol 2-dehydrogenase [Sphingomonas chungangi]